MALKPRKKPDDMDLANEEKVAFLWGLKEEIIPEGDFNTSDWPTWGELALAIYRLAETLREAN